jgi:uncharacterized protein YutE (UPF0331/DUF86 family)
MFGLAASMGGIQTPSAMKTLILVGGRKSHMWEIENNQEINHQNVIAYHHFARASSECLEVYKHGYFISTVMVSQAVTEGILRFILERNGLPTNRKDSEDIKNLVEKNIISQQCGEAFIRIRRSFRNDVHHMNSNVDEVPFKELAKRNMNDLTTIEHEIFAYSLSGDGELVPKQSKYWDISSEGTVPVFLRFES